MNAILPRNAPVTIVQGYSEDGDVTWLLEYYLCTYPNPSNDGKGRFGIKVVRNNIDGTLDKAAETFAVTDDLGEAMAMIHCFAQGAVRPQTLVDMVDEWFSEKALSNDDASGCMPIPIWHTYHVGR
ncbi:MAG: DUF6514 family protein [Firmicutes bacterium]|nr:DUF6514 family protein [Bacillota bacterium]